MIRSKLPCFPRAVPVRVQRKRGKVSVSKRVDRKKVSQQSTKWEWRDDKNGGKLTWQSATNSKHENERRGKKEEGTRAREMLEEWGNNRSKIHISINRTPVIRSDAPQEEIEREMICGVMQVNRWTEEQNLLHSTPNSKERGLQRQRSNKSDWVISKLIRNKGERRGGCLEQVRRNALCLRCYFSHSCFSLAYDYFNHRWFCKAKANEMNALIVIFLPQC